MKYIKFFLFSLSFFAVTFLSSCKKEAISSGLVKTTGVATFPNLAEILLNKAEYVKRLSSKDGYIQFSLYNPIGVKAGTPRVYATFTDSVDRISYGTLSVGSYNLSYDRDIKAYDNFFDYKNNDYLQTLFGTYVTFRLKGKNGIDDEAVEELYIPKSLNVSSPLPSANGSVINKNATFVWDADNTNTLGVAILIAFNPQSPENKQFSTLQSFERVILAKDKGSYTFDSQDLANIPSGCSLIITLARGNLAEIKGLKTGNNYLIYSTSTTVGTYKMN